MNNNSDWFLCKVTASVTHEMQNILAIIKENAGLMEDILYMSQENLSDSSGSRLLGCIKSIKKQAYRGVEFTSGLNRFSHIVDHAQTHINLLDTAKKLIFLIQRIVNQKGIQLLIEDCEKSPSVTSDPFLFQKAIYLCIECLAEVLQAKAVIRIVIPAVSGSLKKVVFESSNHDIPPSLCSNKISLLPKWLETTEICNQISANVEITTKPFGIIFSIK